MAETSPNSLADSCDSERLPRAILSRGFEVTPRPDRTRFDFGDSTPLWLAWDLLRAEHAGLIGFMRVTFGRDGNSPNEAPS